MTRFSSSSPDAIRKYYEGGGIGWIDDPQGVQDLIDFNVVRYGGPEFEGHGDGKRALLWRSREKYDPGALAQESQNGPDCTSHGVRSAIDTTRSVEIHIGNQPEEYYVRTATEPFYGARGHSGAGSSPAVLTAFAVNTGFLGRKNYPGVIDLTRYRFEIGDRWGRTGVPAEVRELAREHSAGSWLIPKTASEQRGLLYSGFASHSGQNLGFSKNSDRYGISIPSGRWNHDMATLGYDDTKEFYSVCVYFVPNSWGQWNYEPYFWPQEAYGPWIPGMLVVAESVYERYFIGTRSIFAFSDIDGYPVRSLPDLGWGGIV